MGCQVVEISELDHESHKKADTDRLVAALKKSPEMRDIPVKTLTTSQLNRYCRRVRRGQLFLLKRLMQY